MSHTKRKHSEFAASNSHIWINCTAAVSLCRKAPPKIETEPMREGTLAHQILEFLVRRFGILQAAKKEALTKFSKLPDAKKFDIEEMIDHGATSAERIYSLRPSKTAKLYIESRVNLNHVMKTPKLFGTLDYSWVELWGDLIVIDYKYGSGVPVAPFDDDVNEENPQLMYYASGIAKTFDYEFDKVKVAVLQPRVWQSGEDALSMHTTTVKRVRDFERKVKLKVTEALSDSPKLNAGDWCRWCPAASFCPEISKVQMDKAGIVFDVEEGIEKLPEVQALTAKSIPTVLDAVDLLETWIGEVRARAFQIATSGEKIKGRKIVQRVGRRQWSDGALDALPLEFGSEAFETNLLSPAQLEKKFGKPGKNFTAEWSKSVSSGISLVKKSDKRTEVDYKDLTPFDLDNNE